ncbi:MAG: LytR/AlgR family response regulator transcription factor [Oscillospiraceae bacterium]
MRVAICDDEKPMQAILENLLNEYSRMRNIDVFVDKFDNGRNLLKAINEREYEIVFMDYQMDDIDGMETSRLIRNKNKECVIIFVSAYPEVAVDSFEVNTFRFIVKPINKEKLFKAIDDYLKSIDYDNLLILKTHEGTWKIKVSDIIYAEAKGKHTIIRTTQKIFEIHIHLKKIEEKLPIEKFCRCQRAYIAGFSHIENHSNTEIFFDNGERAQIGKVYAAKFKKSFQEYIMRYNNM